MGQQMATLQFFLYGRKHFTQTGWDAKSKLYKKPDILDTNNLTGKVYAVTGANSGVGKEISKYLASKGGTLYMICRNEERGRAAQKQVKDETRNKNVHLLLGDVSLFSDIKHICDELVQKEKQLDALVCNAGCLLNEKCFTKEGREVTFACHFLHGTYSLTRLCMPLLRNADEPRVVVVSSGGMYNTKFPSWDVATSQIGDYDGQLVYAFAKRGQVLLCEQWASKYPNITFTSCHPGWTATPGLDKAYGSSKKYLEPLRTLWQGAEGICWLCTTPSNELESGAFYLDRTPQVKHIAGPFFSEGTHTKNTEEEIKYMMKNLKKWSCIPEKYCRL